jgi:aspartyl-tRNA synthetase
MPTGSVEVVLKEFKIINLSKKQLPFVIRDFHKVNAIIDKYKLESCAGYCEQFLKMCILK